MKKFYTNISVVGNRIGYRGIEDGIRVRKKISYTPKFFVQSTEPTPYQNFDGTKYLTPATSRNIWDAKEWIKQNEEVVGFEIYGNPRAEYAYITENFPKRIDYDTSAFYIANIDIEVDSNNGFPDPAIARERVLSITLERNGRYHVWGMKDYTPHIENVLYHKCQDEIELLTAFIEFWTNDFPDVVTGWNIQKFDIPYLLRRIDNLFGTETKKKLSPWDKIKTNTITQFGKEHVVYEFQGIDILDYMDLFKKFSPNAAQESYKLDDIAFEIVKEKKLDYGNRSLAQLYDEDFQKYIEYNIHDTTLIKKIDEKEKLLDLALTLAYQSKTNPSDVFKQVRMWTQIIDDHLARENKYSSAYRRGDHEKERFEGAFVKDSFSGMFEWVASYDATSLYPSLIMQHNISPDTFIDPRHYTEPMREVMAQNIDVETLLDKKINMTPLKGVAVTLTANGHLFRTDKKGFLPIIIAELFEDRKAAKNKMLDAEKRVEALRQDPNADPQALLQAKNDVARYDGLQNAIKTCLNSSFGALGNNHFFHFDVRLAEAITITGKLSNKWATRAVNEYLNRVLKTDTDYVIAGDTDSIYLNLGPLVKSVFDEVPGDTGSVITFMDKVCAGPLAKVLRQAFDEFGEYMQVAEQKIYFKREALSDRAIWTGGKKRYIVNVWNSEGVQYAEPKIKIKGFEMVKSSHPKLARQKMKEAVKVILTKTEPDLWKFIADFKKEFMTFPVEDIAFPRGCHGLAKFRGDRNSVYISGTPQHIKAALIYNNLIEKRDLIKTCQRISDGEKIKFLMLKMPNPIHEEVIAFPYTLPPELNLHEYVDYDAMFDKTFVDPLKIILDAIEWSVKKKISLKELTKKRT